MTAGQPVLHGRDASIAALRHALDDAVAGRGHLVVISGEAGIGKSTLATAIAHDAETRGAMVTWGRAWEFAEAPPYFPVSLCLRTLGIDAHGDAFQLWEQVLTALSRATAPVVWIVEDLHAADLGTLDLLTFLAQPLRALRVLVVATTRERDPRVDDRMLARLTRMARDGIELRLEPLADREVAALTEDTLGRAPSAEAVRKLVELTGGNPLFVVECARAFTTLGALPPTVRQVVLERVGLLSESTRDVLARGAVLGREFSAAAVAHMAGSLPARAIDALLPALRSGVVRETRPGQFMFSHTLVRDAIEDALAASERAELHGQAADALVSFGDSAEVLVERARHALAAQRRERADDTLALATRAAELLEHEGAFDRAHELYTRMAAAREAGWLPAADPTAKLHAARVARAAGRTDASRRLCESVMADARAIGDPELLARAVLLVASDVRPGVVDRGQVALLEEARAALGNHAPALACRVQARLATALQPAPDPAVPMAMARDVRARAVALGDPAVIIDVLELGGWGIYQASLDERNEWAADLRDRALAGANLEKALTGFMLLACNGLEAGDFAAFDRELAGMLATADELGHPRYRWRGLLLASARAIMLGRAAESDRYVTEVEQLAPLTDDTALALALALHHVFRALILRRDADVRTRLASLEQTFAPMVNAAANMALLRGVCLARLGDLDAARRELSIVRARIPLATVGEVAHHDVFLVHLAELIAAAGDDAERRHGSAILAQFTAAEVSGGPMSFTYDGPAARVGGLVAASLGELGAAELALGDALAIARARGHLPWVAQIASELAAVVRRAGRAADAQALADESSRIAREVGMPGLVRDAPRAPDAGPLQIERLRAEWRLTRGESTAVVKDSRGMQLLARLIERPNEEVHVLALASDDGASALESTAGEVLDDRARKSYRRRLAELADALADAESRNDARRSTAIEREREALITELARATGLGGKPRVATSTTERARINVQKRLKDAIGRVAEVDAELGRFLEQAVRTGTFCCFRP